MKRLINHLGELEIQSMKNYETKEHKSIYNQFKGSSVISIDQYPSINLTEFVYFLVQHRIRAFIIDDYLSPITDKNSLIEAIFYQIGLFDIYDLNWDALDESLENYISNNECGIVLIFKNGNYLKKILFNELNTLENIMKDISINEENQAKIVYNS